MKRSVRIPVLANGDIDTPERARQVLALTGADGLMIGRAAQGRPWIFREISHYLATGESLPPPTVAEARALILEHLADHYAFHGEEMGVRTARKHLGWYAAGLAGGAELRREVNAALTTAAQQAAVERFCERLAATGLHLVYVSADAAVHPLSASSDTGVKSGSTWVGEALAA